MEAGYSGTPLPKKLGIKEDSDVLLIQAPEGLASRLGIVAVESGTADVIVFFTTSRLELEHRVPELIRQLKDRGGLWIAWPKKASKVPTDITEDVLREVILPTGLVDNKVCAIDEVWSGLRFVRRVK